MPLLTIFRKLLHNETVKSVDKSGKILEGIKCVIPLKSDLEKGRAILNDPEFIIERKNESFICGKKEWRRKFEVEVSAECTCFECCFCNCAIFLDKAMCPHLIACLIKTKTKYPGIEVAKAQFASRGNRGRPQKAKKALEIQNM